MNYEAIHVLHHPVPSVGEGKRKSEQAEEDKDATCNTSTLCGGQSVADLSGEETLQDSDQNLCVCLSHKIWGFHDGDNVGCGLMGLSYENKLNTFPLRLIVQRVWGRMRH
jgi:hypothetical protein